MLRVDIQLQPEVEQLCNHHFQQTDDLSGVVLTFPEFFSKP